MSAANVEAFATPGITPPPAFDRLRRDLYRAAGPDHLAAQTTRRTVEQMRAKADACTYRMERLADEPEAYWYAEMATRLHQFAAELETDARAAGVLS